MPQTKTRKIIVDAILKHGQPVTAARLIQSDKSVKKSCTNSDQVSAQMSAAWWSKQIGRVPSTDSEFTQAQWQYCALEYPGALITTETLDQKRRRLLREAKAVQPPAPLPVMHKQPTRKNGHALHEPEPLPAPAPDDSIVIEAGNCRITIEGRFPRRQS